VIRYDYIAVFLQTLTLIFIVAKNAFIGNKAQGIQTANSKCGSLCWRRAHWDPSNRGR